MSERPVVATPGGAGDPATMGSRTASAGDTGEVAARPDSGDDDPLSIESLPFVEARHYQLGGVHARGGLGRILKARDRRLARPIAIKELLRSDEAHHARFVREAKITARLQHPGVVPIYEAGRWPNGQPFYAMKLVAGEPLSAVIDGRPRVDDRLALLPKLLAVAETMAYAHSLRVVHRDLKPSNVMIGDYGETVVIDWGLAKDLDEPDGAAPAAGDAAFAGSSDLTETGQVLGTPSYMPPEQARGEPVDARADVYALGAMLYHVLAGASPYRAGAAPGSPPRTVLQGPPPRLASVVDGVPSDLAAIVDKAMARDPAARYEDAAAFAADLGRFTSGRLVSAHRYGVAARLFRLVRRNWVAVTAASIGLALVVVSVLIGVSRVVAERDVARSQRRAAEELIAYMLGDQQKSLKALGKIDLLEGAGRKVIEYYDQLAAHGLEDYDRVRRAVALEIMGSTYREQGHFPDAIATYRAALSERASLLASAPTLSERIDRLKQLADGHAALSTVAFDAIDPDLALASARTAQQLLAPLAAVRPEDEALRRSLAHIHSAIGDAAKQRRDLPTARDEYHAALAILEGLPAAESGIDRDLPVARSRVADVIEQMGDPAAAAVIYRQAVESFRRIAAAAPDDRVHQHTLGYALLGTADAELAAGDVDAALASYTAAAEIEEKLVTFEPANGEWQMVWYFTLRGLAACAIRRGDLATGRKTQARELAVAQRMVDGGHSEWLIFFIETQERIGRVASGAGDVAAARAAYQAIADAAARAVDRETTIPLAVRLRWLAEGHSYLGDVANAHGEPAVAEREYRAGVAAIERELALKPDDDQVRHILYDVMGGLAEAMLEQGHAADAEPVARRALAIAESISAEHTARDLQIAGKASIQGILARALVGLGRRDEARALYDRAIETLTGLEASGRMRPAWAHISAELTAQRAALKSR
jgi:tetratricopeptide (TPR) repeat protein/tRNA A-37 threonylcarbamoyl transferase component Bud32